MIRFRHLLIALIALLACGLAGTAIPPAAQGKATDWYAWAQLRPLLFFVAKGPANACGPHCSEWIAAEGRIDRESGQRLREFLAGLPRQDLPIFLNSPGGNVGQAMALGSILRQHRMTVSIGRTVPDGCRNADDLDEACRRLIESKREHKARLITGGARCVSGCVYALIGGSVREVPRGAHLGVHSARVALDPAHSPDAPLPTVDDVHRLLKGYLATMGVDPGLIDFAAKVGADSVRYLSRDEIARFGVETRGFYETPWMAGRDSAHRLYVLKSVTGPTPASAEYRTNSARFWCFGGEIWFVYQRELAAGDLGAAASIRVVAGDHELKLKETRNKHGNDRHTASAGAEFLRNALAAPSIAITEDLTPAGEGAAS